MTGFVWNPEWHHEGESFWSVVCKISYANNAPMALVLELLTGVTGLRARSTFLACALSVVLHVCKVLNISATQATHLFNGFDQLPVLEREYLSLGLRWCPECIKTGFHSVRFQDWRLISCPWHGCRLMDCCPRCDRQVDPLMQAPWRCNHCHSPVYQPPRDWISRFRRPFENVDFPAPTNRCNMLEPFNTAKSVQDIYWHGSSDIDTAPRRAGAGIQAMEWVREEVGVLLDTVLASHQDCLACEFEASLVQYCDVRFNCPIAGALARAAAWFDVSVIGDFWAPGTRPMHGRAGSWLEYELEEMPAWARRLMVRETFRAWVADATANFAAADGLGTKSAAWAPNRRLNAVWRARESHHVTLKSHCDWAGFTKLVRDSGHDPRSGSATV